MSVNLLDLVKGYLTEVVVEKTASFLGESIEVTQSGLEHIIPVPLGGVMNRARTQSSASNVLELITKPELSEGFLDYIDPLFSGSNGGLMSVGGSLLTSVLGDKLTGVIDLASDLTGLKSGNTVSLLRVY